MGFRFRILLGMLAIIVLAIAGTAVVAYEFDREQQEVYNRLRLQRKEASVERSLEYVFNRHEGPWTDEDVPALFSDRICELSDIHGLSISLYNPQGELLISSLFGAPSDSTALLRVPDEVMRDLADKQAAEDGQDVDYGDFVMAYWNFRDDRDEVVAIANVRYDKRQMEASGFAAFVQRLAPLYILLFIGAGLLALLITNSIVRPLAALRQRLGDLDLQAEQEPLVYDGEDAIGDLVRQYNALLHELEVKVQALAQTEREGAWRSMAMQVAHEIKNPLTPFKLGIQQLNRAAQDGRTDLVERVERFTSMAVAQIDVLSAVAEDFSRMASIDPTEFIDVDLNEVLQSCTDLFGSDDVEFTPSADSMPVRGSRAHLMRVFNNLLSNAVYAVRESERADGLIQVKVNRSGQGWTVEVSDNGIGIDSSRIERIFEPRFTTKSSGSGLGLSMARFMVNHFGGSISVESEFGQGTTFSVWLPQSLE